MSFFRSFYRKSSKLLFNTNNSKYLSRFIGFSFGSYFVYDHVFADKWFINSTKDIVFDMLEGYVDINPHLALLDGFPDIKVVVRRDWDKYKDEKVAIISGGGSGHEPMHSGAIGQGMITACVAGNIFASPSAEAVYAAIKHCAGKAGVLLIVKNYTGDRLNFGIAAERAKAEGIKVEMVIVDDDVAILKGDNSAGRRGIAGTVLVHKIIGALAERNAPLEILKNTAEDIIDNVRTMGCALSVCTIPGQNENTRLKDDEIELGLGIHGEPGTTKMKQSNSKEYTARMLSKIIYYQGNVLDKNDDIVLLVNNLGKSTNMELAIAAKDAISYLQERGYNIRRVYSGSFMTSLNMNGISLSILTIKNDGTLDLLDQDTNAPAWPNVNHNYNDLYNLSKLKLKLADSVNNIIPLRNNSLNKFGKKMQHIVINTASSLLQDGLEDDLNRMDRALGDADAGTTHIMGAKSIIQAAEHFYNFNSLAETTSNIGKTLQLSMGGTSGALYSLFFNAISASLANENDQTNPKALVNAFNAGVYAIKKYGGAKLGDSTY